MENIKNMTHAEHSATHSSAYRKAAPRKKRRGKYTIWGVIAAIFLCGAMLGGVIAVTVFPSRASNSQSEEKAAPLYGTRDGKVIADEPSIIYETESGFVPLNCSLSEDLQEFTYYLCKAYYIDFDFAMGLMFTESSFRADIVSGTNDYGLMQINTINHEWLADKLGITDIKEPHQNIRAGLYILRGLFEKYDTPEKVLMAYNMGEYGASVLWEKGIYEINYSKKVLAKADEYAAQRGADNATN